MARSIVSGGESVNLKALDIDNVFAVDLHSMKLEDLRKLHNFKTLKYKDAIYFG